MFPLRRSATMGSRRPGLGRHSDFRKLWAGQTVSMFGSLVTRVALPLTAVLALVRREELVEANSKLEASASVAEIAAFGLGGVLVQLVTGPVAILLDALSFLASAVAVGAIGTPEPPPAPAAARRGVLREIAE